ncbi:MAG: biopolymer transporter ExbD [Desulfurivibrionaceae bacterium]
MKNSRRIKRMSRNRKKMTGLNLTSLMDVFTILVFFLLFNSASGEVLEAPKEIELPDSVVELKPSETIVIVVSQEMILVHGKLVASTPEVLDSRSGTVPEITERLLHLERNLIGINQQAAVEAKEITLLADKTIPFRILKKIMSTCTAAGYEKISLAVNQEARES